MEHSKTKTIAIAAAGLGGAFAAWRLWKRAEVRRYCRTISAGERIVIVGAGFAGMSAARELSKLLPEEDHGMIHLIDRNNFLLFTPMLSEVAGGELDPEDVVAPTRRLSPRISFMQGVIKDIDLADKSVVLEVGSSGREICTVKASHLVLALGSSPNFHHVPGLREHSLPITTVHDASLIRNRVLQALERADAEPDARKRREILTFVVGGGGYTGVETMAAINDLARASVKKYENVSESEISAIIVESGERLMLELSPDLAAFGQEKLEERGVRILLRTKITRVGEDFVELEDRERIRTQMLVWAGGIAPNPLIEKLDCRRGKHGKIVVDAHCAVPDRPGVWAVGDCAQVPKQGGSGSYTATAQNATRQGVSVARNIFATMTGRPRKPFRYVPVGELALVGRHSAVARIYGHHFSGFIAWAMWRAIYLSKMPEAGRKTRIALDWIADCIFGRNEAMIPVDDSTASQRESSPKGHPVHT